MIAYEKLKVILHEIKNRPKTIMPDPNYNDLKFFIFGYTAALSHAFQIPLNEEISRWLCAKTDSQSSLFWFDQLYYFDANKDPDKAYSLVLQYLEMFLNEKLNAG